MANKKANIKKAADAVSKVTGDEEDKHIEKHPDVEPTEQPGEATPDETPETQPEGDNEIESLASEAIENQLNQYSRELADLGTELVKSQYTTKAIKKKIKLKQAEYDALKADNAIQAKLTPVDSKKKPVPDVEVEIQGPSVGDKLEPLAEAS